MDLNLFKTFDAVMKTRSVNEAAELTGVTPPAVSHALNRLRELYQDPLFIRQGRGITPTNFAIELHAEIEAPLSVLLNGGSSRTLFDPLTSERTFRISSHQDIDVMVLPALSAYQSLHAPNITIHADVERLNEQDRQEELRKRKVDLILATIPFEDHGYHNQLLFHIDLAVAASRQHPRIEDRLSHEQFYAEKHLLWKTQRDNLYALDSLTREKQPERQVAYITSSSANALMMTAQTDWLCVSTRWHIAQFPQLQILPVPFETQKVPIYITWHQSQQNDSGHQWLKQALYKSTECFRQNT